MTVAVVTDSSADLPPEVAEAEGITVLPLVVSFPDGSFRDGEDLSAEEFWRRAATAFPTTASPPPSSFAEAYRSAADAGAEGVVSVHLAEALSGTVHHAATAARDAAIPVQVIDTGSVSGGVGFCARRAADAARDGASLDETAAAARRTSARVEVFAVLETVEFLRRGGRLGAARAMLSDLLRIRPVLTMRDGEPTLLSRPRTRGRAVDDLLARLDGPAEEVAMAHAAAPDADRVAARIREALGIVPLVSMMGAGVGAHLGPGAIGVAVLRPRPGGQREL